MTDSWSFCECFLNLQLVELLLAITFQNWRFLATAPKRVPQGRELRVSDAQHRQQLLTDNVLCYYVCFGSVVTAFFASQLPSETFLVNYFLATTPKRVPQGRNLHISPSHHKLQKSGFMARWAYASVSNRLVTRS